MLVPKAMLKIFTIATLSLLVCAPATVNALIVAGIRDSEGYAAVKLWDGEQWYTITPSFGGIADDGYVCSLLYYEDELYAGTDVGKIYKKTYYNDKAWELVFDSDDDDEAFLGEYNGQLYAGIERALYLYYDGEWSEEEALYSAGITSGVACLYEWEDPDDDLDGLFIGDNFHDNVAVYQEGEATDELIFTGIPGFNASCIWDFKPFTLTDEYGEDGFERLYASSFDGAIYVRLKPAERVCSSCESVLGDYWRRVRGHTTDRSGHWELEAYNGSFYVGDRDELGYLTDDSTWYNLEVEYTTWSGHDKIKSMCTDGDCLYIGTGNPLRNGYGEVYSCQGNSPTELHPISLGVIGESVECLISIPDGALPLVNFSKEIVNADNGGSGRYDVDKDAIIYEPVQYKIKYDIQGVFPGELTIRDVLPDEVDLTTIEADPWPNIIDGRELTWNIGGSAGLVEGHINVTVQPKDNTPIGTGLQNICTVNASSGEIAYRVNVHTLYFAGPLHVDYRVDSSGDGFSWNTAFKTIEEAISTFGTTIKYSNPAEIWITENESRIDAYQGTYSLDGDLFSNWVIRGGFEGTEETADEPRELATIIQGISGQSILKNESWNVNLILDNIILDGKGDGDLLEFSSEGLVIEGFGDNVLTTQSITVKDCEIRNCEVGIQLEGANSDIINTSIHENSERGIFVTDCDVVELRGCRIYNNTCDSEGGGVYASNAKLTIDGSRFQNNISERAGGGAYIYNSEVTISDSNFITNTANVSGGAGGALSLNSCVKYMITNSNFSGNQSYVIGGGLDILKGGDSVDCGIYRCKFIDNKTTSTASSDPGYGGAISIEENGETIPIKRCIFVDNKADWAGAIAIQNTPLGKEIDCENCTFIGNRALMFEGGAIETAEDGRAVVKNSVFWGNTGESDSGKVIKNYSGTLSLTNYASSNEISNTYYDVTYRSNGNEIENPFLSLEPEIDWHIVGNSSCIDKTDSVSTEAETDIDNETEAFRLTHSTTTPWDWGADEYHGDLTRVYTLTDPFRYYEPVDENTDEVVRIYFRNAIWAKTTGNADYITLERPGYLSVSTHSHVKELLDNTNGVVLFSTSQATTDGYVEFKLKRVDGDTLEDVSFIYSGVYQAVLYDKDNVEKTRSAFYIENIPPTPQPYISGISNPDNSSLTFTSIESHAPLLEGGIPYESLDSDIGYPVEYLFVGVNATNGQAWSSEHQYTISEPVLGAVYKCAVKARFKHAPVSETILSGYQQYEMPAAGRVIQAVNGVPGKSLVGMISPGISTDYLDPTILSSTRYSFNNKTTGITSGLIVTPYWIDESATLESVYTIQYHLADANNDYPEEMSSSESEEFSASSVTWGANDDLPPFPEKMQWLQEPTVSSDLSTIMMEAVEAVDIDSTVEYRFECLSDPNYTRDFNSVRAWSIGNLPINTAFTFTVQARDGAGNVGEASDLVTVWTDNTPPSLTSSSSSFYLNSGYNYVKACLLDDYDYGDTSDVQFARVSSTGTVTDDDVIRSSGWVEIGSGIGNDLASWTDSGLYDDTAYWYSYRLRDTAGNVCDWASAVSATTDLDDRYPSPDPMAWDDNTPIHYEGKTCVIIAAQEAVLPSTLGAPIEYRFNCSDANFTSDWQDSPVGEIRGLQPSTSYTFTVQARRGDYGYEDYVTGPSSSLTVTTQSGAWTQDSIVRDVELGIWYEDLGIAMFEAASGHHLELQPGTHSLTEPLTFVYNSGLTLCSTDPEDPYVVAATILDASQCAPIVVFQGETWEDPVTSRLEGLTITGADDPNVNGAIQVQGYSSAALSNCVLSYNTTGNGGAIYTYTGSELLLSDCILHDNTADLADGFKGFGGAIYGSTVTLSDCELYENQADRGGGAIYVTDLTMTRCSVHDNETLGHGGAIYSSRPSLANCQIYNNSSEDQGGGLYSYTSASNPAVLTNCLFKNNEAVDGGGLRCSGNPGAAVIRGCVFVDNTSTEDGGGISMNGALTLSNCTVVDNTAISTGAGGGIYQGNGDFDLINCLFAGNTPTPYPSGNIYSPDLYSCLIQGATLSGSTAYLNGNPIGQLEGGVLLGSDPLLVDDYHLSSSSPCVDAGLNSVTKPITDIDGELRTVNGTVDIGADEYFDADEIPPSPVAWDVVPVAVDCNTVTMRAVTASDASGPVLYRFDCNDPDPNFNSGWRMDPNNTVTGLTPEATYGFSLQVRDAAGNQSESTAYSYVTLPSETASFVATNLTSGGSYETIEAALDDASNDDVIQIQTGTYDVALDLDGLDITLCGTDPNDPNVVAATILTNSSDGPVLTFPSGSNCQIKGLTITDSNNLTGSGGGVYATNSDLIFQQCRIVNCHTTGNGGGLYGYDCDVTLVNCEFLGNSASGYGGGVYTDIDDLVKVVNCVFYQNSAATGGGIYLPITTSESTCTHSTFVDNTASVDAGGLFGFDSVDNSIFWGNRSSSVGDYHIDGSPAPNMTAGLIEGGIETDTQIKASDNSTIAYKNGGQFVFEDPCFVNGYYLPDDSSAIDNAHNSDALLDVDIAGQPRIVGVPDLGAHEVQNRQAFGLLASTLGYNGEVRTGGDADWSPTIFDWPTSGEIEDSQFTWMSAFIDGAGTASFNWRSYSEASSDYLQCYADGVLLDELSGVSGTQSVTHQFNLSGPHVMRWIYIKDTSGYGSYDCGYVYNMSFTPSTPTGDPTGVVTAAVNSDQDDVEEDEDGVMELTDTDLDLKYMNHQILVGLRFSGVGVPQGATILDAYLTVQADESDSSTCSLEVWAQASDDAEPFTTTAYDLSSRSMTTASVSWSPETYVFPNYYNSPDLSSIIQEVVDRPDWLMGNGMVLKIQVSEGERVFENNPVLHIQYQVP